MHRVVLAGCLLGLAGLAGCALGGPGAGTAEHSLSLEGVDGPVERLELRYSNGTTRSVAVAGPEGPGGPTTGVYDLRNVTGVAVDGRSERVALTLAPGRAAPASCPSPRARRSY